MPRPILLLVLLLAACSQNSSMQMPRFELQPPPLAAPRGAGPAADARYQACRAEATRVVTFRERGQTMRNDDLAISTGSFGNDSAVPDWRRQMTQVTTEQEIERLTRQCIASGDAQPAAAAAR